MDTHINNSNCYGYKYRKNIFVLVITCLGGRFGINWPKNRFIYFIYLLTLFEFGVNPSSYLHKET